MVSFKTLLPLTALFALVQAGSHAHFKRFRYQANHYHNGTETNSAAVTSSPLGTGIQTTEMPAVSSSTVSISTFTHPPAQSAPVATTCLTKYETDTYTYTLGNGKAHTATITHTKIITRTLTPVPEATKVDSVADHTPGANAEEDPEYTSTTTSTTTTTVLVTLTRTLPLPKVTNPPVDAEETSSAPCHVDTVYITIPMSVSVSTIKETFVQTVKETVKETITVTKMPISEQPPVPMHTPPPGHPPYGNHSTISRAPLVTLTMVPLPYETI